jgi:hypothetical protein
MHRFFGETFKCLTQSYEIDSIWKG